MDALSMVLPQQFALGLWLPQGGDLRTVLGRGPASLRPPSLAAPNGTFHGCLIHGAGKGLGGGLGARMLDQPFFFFQTTEKRGKESKTAFGGPVVSSLYQEETIR